MFQRVIDAHLIMSLSYVTALLMTSRMRKRTCACTCTHTYTAQAQAQSACTKRMHMSACALACACTQVPASKLKQILCVLPEHRKFEAATSTMLAVRSTDGAILHLPDIVSRRYLRNKFSFTRGLIFSVAA